MTDDESLRVCHRGVCNFLLWRHFKSLEQRVSHVNVSPVPNKFMQSPCSRSDRETGDKRHPPVQTRAPPPPVPLWCLLDKTNQFSLCPYLLLTLFFNHSLTWLTLHTHPFLKLTGLPCHLHAPPSCVCARGCVSVRCGDIHMQSQLYYEWIIMSEIFK